MDRLLDGATLAQSLLTCLSDIQVLHNSINLMIIGSIQVLNSVGNRNDLICCRATFIYSASSVYFGKGVVVFNLLWLL